jgi:hypothetical protein
MSTRYAHKTHEELLFIIKDAGEAAAAMRGHDPHAEAKYLDQINDAYTELASRKRQFIVIRSPKQEFAATKNGFVIVVSAIDEDEAIRVAAKEDPIFDETVAPEYFGYPVSYSFHPKSTYSA